VPAGVLGDGGRDSGLVFTREDGSPIHPMSLSQFFEKRVAGAGVPPLPLHGLRHTHATLGLAAGSSRRSCENGSATRPSGSPLTSTHTVPAKHREAAERIAALIPRS